MLGAFVTRIILLFATLIVIDGLLAWGLKRMLPASKRKGKSGKRFLWMHFSFSLLFIAYAITHFLIIRQHYHGYADYRQLFFITGLFILIYLPKLVVLVFIVAENALLFFLQFLSYLFQNKRHYEFVKRVRKFKLLSWMGYIAGWILFVICIYGATVTRTDYQVVEETIKSKRIPPAFDGLRIVHISDAHLGSFFSPGELDRALDLINEQKPDVIVFTGDMINVEAAEALPYIEKFRRLQAPLGKFAVMGNHDHDDYMKISTSDGAGKMDNEKLALYERAMGFTVLRNQHTYLVKGKDSLLVVGVDSWGLKPFKQYGDLKASLKGSDQHKYSILLSHIPNHWEMEVQKKTGLDLTLSGHTHALQIGVELGHQKFSPVSLLYQNFWGLYREGDQFINVNPGLGYLGFPGRIGVRPEITVITLKHE